MAPSALMIMRELVCCRLPDVDAGVAAEMLSRDLGLFPPIAAFPSAAAISRSSTSMTIASSLF
jgi:hypothetical protein